MATRASNNVFSGEPLPIPPRVKDPELDMFHRKLIDYLRRLGAKLSTYPSGGGGSTTNNYGNVLDYGVADISPGFVTIPCTAVDSNSTILFNYAYPGTLSSPLAELYLQSINPGVEFTVNIDGASGTGVSIAWAVIGSEPFGS